jgi:uncharacterized protein YwqG
MLLMMLFGIGFVISVAYLLYHFFIERRKESYQAKIEAKAKPKKVGKTETAAEPEYQRRRPLVSADLSGADPIVPEHEAVVRPVVSKPLEHSEPLTEAISVVLRKQVPPRDEPPSSWLGGLPMLPDDVEWPRGGNPEYPDKGSVPLHFIAQINCAELPKDLWAGLGPRQGWLLLFVNSNTSDSGDRGTWRVLHVDALGEERQPPADIGSIHDGVYCGSTEWIAKNSIYPRWPVDLVTVRNELRIEHGRSLAAPENFASILYEGRAVAEDNAKAPIFVPFTWRCLSEAIDLAAARLTAPQSTDADRNRQQMLEKLSAHGAFADIVPALERELAEQRSRAEAALAEPETDDMHPAERERYAKLPAYIAQREAEVAQVADVIATNPNPAALIAYIDNEKPEEWRKQIAERLFELKQIAEDEGLDSLLDADSWQMLQQALAPLDTEKWVFAWAHRSEGPSSVTIKRHKLTVMEWLSPELRTVCPDIALRHYLNTAERHLIPDEVLPALEAQYRALYENRPHRMGGYHDGLQSDAQEGPPDQLLLLQFATDYPMQWHWGDNGAVYCFIKSADLQVKAWDNAEFYLECH